MYLFNTYLFLSILKFDPHFEQSNFVIAKSNQSQGETTSKPRFVLFSDLLADKCKINLKKEDRVFVLCS